MDGPQWFTAYGRRDCRADSRRETDALDNHGCSICPVACWHGQQLYAWGLDPPAPRPCSHRADLQPALWKTRDITSLHIQLTGPDDVSVTPGRNRMPWSSYE